MPLHSCAEPNSVRSDFGVTSARQLIRWNSVHVSNLICILYTEKAKDRVCYQILEGVNSGKIIQHHTVIDAFGSAHEKSAV